MLKNTQEEILSHNFKATENDFVEATTLRRFEESLSKEDKESLMMWATTVYNDRWFLELYNFYMDEIVNKTIKGRGNIDSAYYMMAGLTIFKKEFERFKLNLEDKNK